MEKKNIKTASRENMKGMPEETNIDYENDENSEYLKKLGRQTED
jgi:hypothetical protein